MKFKSIEDVVNHQYSVDRLSGVYFLLYKNHLVYVGQSLNGTSRISDHRSDKLFDAWSWMPVEAKYLNDVEHFYIDKFKPEYNRVSGKIDAKNLATFFGMEISVIREMLKPTPVSKLEDFNINEAEERIRIRMKKHADELHERAKEGYQPKKQHPPIKKRHIAKKYKESLSPSQKKNIRNMKTNEKLTYIKIAEKLKLKPSRVQSFLARNRIK